MSESAWAPDSEQTWQPPQRQRRGRGQAYVAASHHSGRVRFLRKAIPISAGVAVVAVLAVSLFNPFRGSGVAMGPISLSGTKVTMEHPKLTGFRKDEKPYEVTAVTAAQDVRKPNIVELEQITARLGMEGDKAARLQAASGLYDMKGESLNLTGPINVKTDDGNAAVLKSAQIDFKGGAVVTRDPIRITLSDGGTVDAKTMDLRDNGKRITFEGEVRTVLYFDESKSAAKGNKATDTQSPPPQGTGSQANGEQSTGGKAGAAGDRSSVTDAGPNKLSTNTAVGRNAARDNAPLATPGKTVTGQPGGDRPAAVAQAQEGRR